MSLPPDPDAWMDAFDPAEIDDPELEEVDASVDRVLRRLGRRAAEPVRARWRTPVVATVGAVALAAGTLLGVWWANRAPEPTAAPAEAPVATSPSNGPSAPTVSPEEPPVPPQVVIVPASSPPPPSSPPIAPETIDAVVVEALPERNVLPGLLPHTGAVLEVRGDSAVLTSGLVSWIHDQDHEPGVASVAFRDLPVVVRPVGTAFTVAAAPSLGSVAVTEGHVRIEHADGSLLAALDPGEELTIAADARSPLGVRLLETDDRPLDEVAGLAWPRCKCRPEDVVALVASLRLALLDPPVPLKLTEDLPEEP